MPWYRASICTQIIMTMSLGWLCISSNKVIDEISSIFHGCDWLRAGLLHTDPESLLKAHNNLNLENMDTKSFSLFWKMSELKEIQNKMHIQFILRNTSEI